MEFMDLLREWLNLRDNEHAEVDDRPFALRQLERERMAELEDEINKLVRGKL